MSKKYNLRILPILTIVFAIFSSLHSQVPLKSNILIDLQEEKAPVSKGLSGIFMEEISYAFDGGIYAELIRNRSFEEGILPPGMKIVENEDGSLRMELEKLPAGVPLENYNMPWPWNGNCGWDPERALIGWSLRQDGQATAMELTDKHPMNEASSLSLELKINENDREQRTVSLINSGYWGIRVDKGTGYKLKFYLRAGTFKGDISVSLEDANGSSLATHKFNPANSSLSEEWVKYTADLIAEGSSPYARLAITFNGSGSLQIDWVSLFPPTYKNRENGLRIELAKYLEDLKPDFVRYPGGCYVQGLSWESAPDWRKMVCPPEERPGMWGYWKYRSTDGFGYHEFLEFCEDINADAMYVSFAGMTVHPDNNWPIEEIDTIIQQTIDAIEYALGPTDSKWGSVRAKMGHPKPFPLKYVEIGNEHPVAVYGDYYVKFREAIKAKYPDITVIMSMYWSGLNHAAIKQAGDENIDIVDEHAYRNADWIRSNYDYFDKYKRKPWKVYVGEYASHHNEGNLYAALSDASYLMMMERNGDLVTMASYAPLFVNVNEKSWGINLIEFDAARSFAHTSYYVQKVFNENRPDVDLKIETDLTPLPDKNTPVMTGKFGLGSFKTSCEFKDLKIYNDKGELVFSDAFESLENWQIPGEGDWKAENGVLKQEDSKLFPSKILLNNLNLSTGKVTLKAKRVEGEEGFVLFFNVNGDNRFMFCNYGAAGNKFSAIQSWGNPENYAVKEKSSTQGEIESDRWYDLTLILDKHTAEMYLDGVKVSDASVEPLMSFITSAGYERESKNMILKAVNYNSEPVHATVRLNGVSKVGKKGKHIVLSSEKYTDENSLDSPLKILPEERVLNNCSKEFTVVLEPYSVNLIKVPVTKKKNK